MPLYEYKAVDRDGSPKEGSLSAENEEKLVDRLREMGLTVIDVRQANEEPPEDPLGKDVGISFEFGVSPKVLTFFIRQFAITLNAGLPLTRIISTLHDQSSSKALKKILREVGRDIQQGESLSSAFGKHRDTFGGLFLSMLSVGEASGKLPEAMKDAADLMEKDQATIRKVRAGMSYPLFVIVFSSVLCYVMLAILMPGFAPIFQNTGLDIENEFPITFFLMQMSSILTNPVVVGLTVFFLVGLIVAVNVMGRNEKGRYALDYIKFNFPFINQIIRISIVTRFCRSFATLVNSGVPMMKTLELVGSASGSMVVARVMQKLAGDIKEGDSVSRAMKKTGIFPDLVIQMVSVGEEAGNIAELLGRTGDYFQQELDAAIESVMSLLEPVMMVIVGIIVGLFVMGILLPVLGITAKFGG